MLLFKEVKSNSTMEEKNHGRKNHSYNRCIDKWRRCSGNERGNSCCCQNCTWKRCEVRGIRKGYKGLLNEEIIDLDAGDVSDIIQRGGTILQTARCKEMITEEGQQKAAAICKKYGIDGLVVIGGDGSFRGAQKLAYLGVNTIGVPGTIDLDIDCTDVYDRIDTAVNTAYGGN